MITFNNFFADQTNNIDFYDNLKNLEENVKICAGLKDLKENINKYDIQPITLSSTIIRKYNSCIRSGSNDELTNTEFLAELGKSLRGEFSKLEKKYINTNKLLSIYTIEGEENPESMSYSDELTLLKGSYEILEFDKILISPSVFPIEHIDKICLKTATEHIKNTIFHKDTLIYDTQKILYSGNFKNNLPHGYGKLFNKNGQMIYSGYFIDGLPYLCY